MKKLIIILSLLLLLFTFASCSSTDMSPSEDTIVTNKDDQKEHIANS